MEVAGNGNRVVDDARGTQLIDEHGNFHRRAAISARV
jgi:hypothetical protein